MSEHNQRLEQFMTELTLRMVASRWREFDVVFECAKQICERYEAEQRRLQSKGSGSTQSNTLP